MEQFDQLESVPRFQPLNQDDVNHRPTSPALNNKHSTSPPTFNTDQSPQDLMTQMKGFPTVSGIDFMYGYRDGNISPSNHEHNDDTDHHQGNNHSDGEERVSVGGLGVGETADLAGKNKVNKFMGKCKVCGDDASGMYFGALVCVPCKTFFLRYYGDNFSFVCRNQKDCEINIKTRTQCKYCRMQKCLQVGMLRRVRPSQVQISEGQQLCVVCSDLANGLHFGAITCEGCKKFFRRGLKEHPTYVCKNDKDCVINPRTRNACRYCRYQKCLMAGMCREAIQMGRPSKFRGHSLYNSNLPFPKMSRTEESNGSASSNPPVTMVSTVPMTAGTSLPFNNPNVSSVSSLIEGPKSLPVPQLDSRQILGMVRSQEIKVEPPDYDFHQSPVSYSPYGNPSPHPAELQDSILNMSNPWEMSIKTMNQEMNCAVSNFLTSNQNELIEQITQNLKYTTAGVMTTETSSSLTTMSSVCEPQSTSVMAVCGALPSQMVNSGPLASYNQKPIPSPEELDIMVNLQKALAVLEEPHLGVITPQDSVIIGDLGTEVQTIPASPITTQSRPVTSGQHHFTNQQQTNPDFPLQTSSMVQQGPIGQQVQGSWPLQSIQPLQQPPRENLQEHVPRREPIPREPPRDPPQVSAVSPSVSHTSPTSSHTSSLSPTTQQMSPSDMITKVPDTSKYRADTKVKKVPLNEIVKSEVPQPLGVQQDRLESFNNFMSLSHQQLIEWIEFLQQERKSISSNNHTIRVIKQNSTQDFSPEYWQKPVLPDENIFFTEDHRQILDQITRAYSAFVEGGHKINIQLNREFQEWLTSAGYASADQITDSDFPDAFNKRVVELYTVCSVAYCKKLPGFVNFDPTDQYNIVRLGQSQSRILAAACHWYNKDKKEFQYFLSWKPKNALREYKFKDSCVKYAEMIVHRDWDHVESALTNVLVLIATDYPDLKNPEVIEQTRMDILKSFRAYTTAKYGTPNRRIEELFSYIPKLRELGLLHYKWTMVTVLEDETYGNKPETDTKEDLLL